MTPPNPAFLVGVTGYMELAEEDVPEIRARIVRMFRFLRQGAACVDPEPVLEMLVKDLAGEKPAMAEVYRQALKGWKGLKQTPIILLSGLAPGADTLVVDTVLETINKEPGGEVHIRAPLAFSPTLYRDASTFVHKKAAAGEDLQAGNKARQEKFDALCRAIGDENCFAVDLAGDGARQPQEFAKEMEATVRADDSNQAAREARHRRFYAAGEFLAVHCHLLLAIWNGEKEKTSAGTAAVVQARLSGPRPGVLANTQQLAVAHGGPLLHLAARRNNSDSKLIVPPMRLLHPYVFSDKPLAAAGIIAAEQENDPELQESRLTTFVDAANDLEKFNELAATTDAKAKLEEMFLGSRGARNGYRQNETTELSTFLTRLQQHHLVFYNGLHLISDLRAKASGATSKLSARSANTLWWLILLTFLPVVSLHIFADGEPRSATESTFHAETVRKIFGVITLGIPLAGLAYFAFVRRRQDDEHAHDYRALSEAQRVQFYWSLAGLGYSTSASYMQRQRSELDWIRGAVRSLSFPYLRWPEWFDRLEAADQKLAIRCVHRGWIQQQLSYFRVKFKEHHYDLESHHRLGKAAALTALGTFAICVAEAFSPGLESALTRHWFATAACGIGSLVLAALVTRAVNCEKGEEKHKKSQPEIDRRRWWQKGLDLLLPAGAENDRSLGGFIKSALEFQPLTIGSVLLVEALCHAARAPQAPETGNLQLIAVGALLAVAALSVAWAEKRLYSEMAYQYNTMASLFQHADQRMGNQLETLDPALGDFACKLKEIQEFLFALGKEALDENAQWLMLHRARPLEPVMPG
jgi:hypothetical protein